MQPAEPAGPKLICINLRPNTATQAPERSDILNVGGFSDAVFCVVAAFLATTPAGSWPRLKPSSCK